MDDRSTLDAPLRWVLIAGIVLAGVGCHTWKAVSSAPPDGATIRVTYAAPRDVMATDSAGNSIRIAAVRHWDGTVTRAVPDTMHVRMTSASAPSASLPQRTVMVAVVREPGVTITRQSVHVIRTILAVWFVAGTIAAFVSPGDRSVY